ncbi:MAG TPA: YCF48-related protein [Candidatus Binatia bacterium]|nr:YCF48-related protein [Candidatus Binatia bacterium]
MSVRVLQWRLRRWQVMGACLAMGVVGLGLVGWGAVGAWQGYTDNPSNAVASESVTPVPLGSVHCSGGTAPYSGCSDSSGNAILSWAAVGGSPGLTVFRAASPGGPYSALTSLAGSATGYTDAGAAYNAQYYYQVASEAQAGWPQGADIDMALSLPPTGGTDNTAGTGGTALTGPYTQTGTNLYAMATAGGTSYTTTTAWGGANANPLAGDQVNGVDCVSTTQCWVVTQDGAIWASSDGGYTWTQQYSPGQQLNGIDCVNASDCWAVGGNKENIYGTTNGGATWGQLHSHPGATFQEVDFANASVGWVVGSGGIVWTSIDGGADWSAQTSNTTQQLNGISCVSATQCWAVGNGGTIIVTASGGTTWSIQSSATGNNLNDISCVSPTQCWAVGGNGTILVFNGTGWSAQTSCNGQTLNGVDMVSATTGWAVGVGGTVCATTNGGATWAAQGSGINQPINSVSAVGSTFAVMGLTPGGGTPSIVVTTNGGANWFQPSSQYLQWTFNPQVAPGAPVTSAVVTLVDRATQALSSTAETYLMVSANAGGSWTAFPLANPTTALVVQTVNVAAVIGTAAAVSGLELRYVISDASGFQSVFDLVHVDIN